MSASAADDLPPLPPPASQPPQPTAKSPLTSERSLKQLGLCAAGIGSIILSTVITRRAVKKHLVIGQMKMFQQSNRTFVSDKKGEGSLLAVEALQIATMNMASWAVMAVGGVSWALDVSSIEELRRYTRAHTRGDPDQTDEEAEEKLQADLVQLMSKYMSETQVQSLLQKAIEEKRAAADTADATPNKKRPQD